jgi:hypothetical protein
MKKEMLTARQTLAAQQKVLQAMPTVPTENVDQALHGHNLKP